MSTLSHRNTATVTENRLRITYTYSKGYRVSFLGSDESWHKLAWFAFATDLKYWGRSNAFEPVVEKAVARAVELIENNHQVWENEHQPWESQRSAS